MNIIITKDEWENLAEWQEKFEQARRIKNLAFKLQYKVPHDLLDKRVDFAWSKVKELEPFPTFKNGILIPKAAMLLNMIKIKKVWKTAKNIQII